MNVRRTDFDDRELAAWWDTAYNTDRLVRNTFFQSREWNRTWYECYVRPDPRRELALLRVERGGVIVAAVPLFLQKRDAGPFTAWRYFLWIADRLAQYPDLITTETDVQGVWDTVRFFLAEEYPDAWLLLRDVLPESTLAAASLPGAERKSGDVYLRIDLRGEDEAGYARRCVPHMRREIRRARKLLETDASLCWVAERNPSPERVDLLIELNRRRFAGASWFADMRNADFFRAVCARAGADVLITSVVKERRPVHMMCSYIHDETVSYVLSGMDARAKALSPGSMNIDGSIRWALRGGYRCFDFLRGDEAYKREFSPESRTGATVEIPAPRGKSRRALARAAQHLRRLVGNT